MHGIPPGPLFLKDWSPTVLGKHQDYKLGVIRSLLETYEDLPFVLIGDSGEEDPEIYLQAIREHPERIKAVYIRDVTPGKRDAEVHAIAEEAGSSERRWHRSGYRRGGRARGFYRPDLTRRGSHGPVPEHRTLTPLQAPMPKLTSTSGIMASCQVIP